MAMDRFVVRLFGPGVGKYPGAALLIPEEMRTSVAGDFLAALRQPPGGEQFEALRASVADHDPVEITYRRIPGPTGATGALVAALSRRRAGEQEKTLEGLVVALLGEDAATDEAALAAIDDFRIGDDVGIGLPPHVIQKIRSDERPLLAVIVFDERAAADPFVRASGELFGMAFFQSRQDPGPPAPQGPVN